MYKRQLQERVSIAGLEILEVRITHLSYASEIAAAMLQRQQAEAVVVARKKIVDCLLYTSCCGRASDTGAGGNPLWGL